MKAFDQRNKAGTRAVLGLRISDSVTKERFRFLFVSLDADEDVGGPGDDTPLA